MFLTCVTCQHGMGWGTALTASSEEEKAIEKYGSFKSERKKMPFFFNPRIINVYDKKYNYSFMFS